MIWRCPTCGESGEVSTARALFGWPPECACDRAASCSHSGVVIDRATGEETCEECGKPGAPEPQATGGAQRLGKITSSVSVPTGKGPWLPDLALPRAARQAVRAGVDLETFVAAARVAFAQASLRELEKPDVDPENEAL